MIPVLLLSLWILIDCPTCSLVSTPVPPTASVSIAPTPSPAPTSAPLAGCPIPAPALTDPVNPVQYGADPNGLNNSAAAFGMALAASDLQVPAGTFLLNSTVGVPNGRRIRCDPGTLLKTTLVTAFTMFKFDNNSGGGVWGCHFAGTNYNVDPPGYVGSGQQFIFHQSTDTGGTAGNLTIANNDFNGINGWTAAVMIYAASTNQPPPHGDVIACNSAEHCGYNWLQITSARDTVVHDNATVDCSGDVEADNTGQQNTGNVVTRDHMTFIHGVGYANHGGGNGGSWNHLTCGASASGTAYNYSGNTCSYNTCDGTQAAWIYQSAVGGSQNNAKYIGNTVSGSCTVH